MSGSRILRLIAVLLCGALFVTGCGGDEDEADEDATDEEPDAGAEEGYDLGIGSEEALAGPNCDPETGRMKFPSYLAPECVKPWPASGDNGGATADGVTATEIKVVVLLAPKGSMASGPRNRTTGEVAEQADAFLDDAAVVAHLYETYGRTVKFEFVRSQGTGEAAAGADAVEVVGRKPFAVIDLAAQSGGGAAAVGGGRAFQDAVEARGVKVLAYTKKATANTDINVLQTTELICKSLAGKPAEWAGAEELQGEERSFGIISTSGSGGIDTDLLERELGECDLEPTVMLEWDPPPDAAQAEAEAQNQVPLLIGRLKDAGVNVVVPYVEGLAFLPALTKEATKQKYFPEWLYTGYQYNDLEFYAQRYDQEQWRHAYGPSYFAPYTGGAVQLTLSEWYWGKDQGSTFAGTFAYAYALYNGIMMSGPNLTRATYEAAIDKIKRSGGAASGHVSTLQSNPAGPGGTSDFTLKWYDPEVTGKTPILANESKGIAWALDGGKRYQPGDLEETDYPFFSKEGAVIAIDPIPADEVPPQYPCEGCPSSGAAAPKPSAYKD